MDEYKRKLEEIKKHPEKHRHVSYDSLVKCCTLSDGAIHCNLVEAHELYATHGDSGCDVLIGPCCCGKVHMYRPTEHTTINPDAVLDQLRVLFSEAGPRDIEHVLELFISLDTHILNGGSLPKDWESALKKGRRKE